VLGIRRPKLSGYSFSVLFFRYPRSIVYDVTTKYLEELFEKKVKSSFQRILGCLWRN